MNWNTTLRACIVALVLIAMTSSFAFAWGVNTDVFDWYAANAATKEEMVTELQEILLKKNILNKRHTASSLVQLVEERLAIDNEQAIIIDKMCEGLNLNCESLW